MPSIFASDNDPTFCDTRIFFRGGCLGALGQGHHGLKHGGHGWAATKINKDPVRILKHYSFA